jgi:hypothetical protein
MESMLKSEEKEPQEEGLADDDNCCYDCTIAAA